MKICLSLYGSSDEICRSIESSPEADLYEIRLDLSPQVDFSRIRSASSKPLVFAAHGKPELLNDASSVADYLDVEQGASSGVRSIVSVHVKRGNAMELWRKFAGDHITKIVLETTDYGEMASLLQLNNLYAPLALCFAMGEAGAFTRILSVFRGAPWIYASLPGRSTAAGQFTLEELTHLYRIRRFEAEPAVFGILGDPVAHSKSPDFHNGKFSENSLPWIYLPFPCKDLASLLRHSLEFGLTGLSVTHPYKEEVLKYVENVSAVARRLRSCNTLCYKDRRWHGTNTDVEGISEMLEKLHIPVNDARILILGAGASARAIASVVRSQARELVVLNRTRWKAADLAAEFQGRSGGLEEFSQFDYDILFHATPLGLHENECPVNPELLKKGVTVIDAIYEPRDTLLLKKARQLGCRTMNGEEWFYAQAEAQFQWWRKMLA